MVMIRAHVYYSGMVQGVGFRFTTQRYAQALKLTGWVKNLPDGRVEILAQGDRKKIESLFKNLDNHFGGYIKDCNVDYQPVPNEIKDFKIVY